LGGGIRRTAFGPCGQGLLLFFNLAGEMMTIDSSETGPSSDDARIDQLKQRISAAQQQEDARTGQSGKNAIDNNYRMGNRVLADLIAGIGGGALIGWVLDQFFGTTPWLLLIFLFLGIIVAFRNIVLLASGKRGQKS
jgi:ATP synthase protein I